MLVRIVDSTTLAVMLANIFGLSKFLKLRTTFLTLIYSWLLQIIEPLMMIIEVIQILHLVLNFGETLREKIEQCQYDEDEKKYSLLYKSFTILLTLINYIIGFWIIFQTIAKYPEYNTIISITSFIIMCIGIALLAFNFYKECNFLILLILICTNKSFF